jgi:membrane protein required for colicin V production
LEGIVMHLEMQNVNWVDWGILSLVGLSVIMGLWRGFVREAMSLVTWIAALTIGFLYTEPLSEMFHRISMVGLRYLLAFVLLVLSVLIIGGIVSHLITRLITFTGFGATDRIMGTLFGFARGAIVVAAAIMVIAPTPISKDPLWTKSNVVPRLSPLSEWMRERIPQDLIKKLHFEPPK